MNCSRHSTVWTSAVLVLAAAYSAHGAEDAAVRVEFDDIPRLVRERNRSAAGAALQAEAAGTREGSLLRSFLPAAALDAGVERFRTGGYAEETQPYGSAEIRVNLLRGGRDYWQERRLEGLASAARARSSDDLAFAIGEARRSFLRLVHAREMGALTREAQAENRRLLERAERRIRRGLAAETDRLEFEIGASQLKEDEESYAHSELQLRLRLAALLGLRPEAGIDTPASVEHDHDETLLARAFDPGAHREAALLSAQRDAARAEAGSASLWWAPSLDAYAGKHLYTLRERDYTAASLRDDFAVGGKLSLRLFDGGAERAEARARRLEAAGAEQKLLQRRLDLTARVRITEEDLKHDHELVHFAEQRIALGRRYFDATLDEYDRGVKNSLDAFAAAQRLLSYRRQLAERRRDYQLTKASLLQELGL